jgi:cell division protein FtsB
MARKAALNILFVLTAVGAGLYASRAPWQAYREQQAAADEQTQEMRESEKRRADLMREEARVRSTVGREELARANGYIRPGEERVAGTP